MEADREAARASRSTTRSARSWTRSAATANGYQGSACGVAGTRLCPVQGGPYAARWAEIRAMTVLASAVPGANRGKILGHSPERKGDRHEGATAGHRSRPRRKAVFASGRVDDDAGEHCCRPPADRRGQNPDLPVGPAGSAVLLWSGAAGRPVRRLRVMKFAARRGFPRRTHVGRRRCADAALGCTGCPGRSR